MNFSRSSLKLNPIIHRKKSVVSDFESCFFEHQATIGLKWKETESGSIPCPRKAPDKFWKSDPFSVSREWFAVVGRTGLDRFLTVIDGRKTRIYTEYGGSQGSPDFHTLQQFSSASDRFVGNAFAFPEISIRIYTEQLENAKPCPNLRIQKNCNCWIKRNRPNHQRDIAVNRIRPASLTAVTCHAGNHPAAKWDSDWWRQKHVSGIYM